MSTSTSAARRARRAIIVTAALAVLGGALATAASSATPRATADHAAASPRAAAAIARAGALGVRGTVHYAVNRPVCVPQGPDRVQCDAIRRVPATASNPNAYAYVEAANLTHGPAGGYTPSDLASAYGFNPNTPSSKQLVGVVLWYDDPHALADLNHFDQHYGLPKETSKSFRKVNQAGNAQPLPTPDQGSSVEISLDIESIRAVCHTCRILLVEAKAPSLTNLGAAENTAARMGATEINNSYGAPEKNNPTVTNKVDEDFDHPGVVITASTGDHGWFGWDFANSRGGQGQSSPSFPSTSPYVVSVGGTDIALGPNGTRAGEIVWNENGPNDKYNAQPQGAGGGGCSQKFASPPWQQHYPGYSATGCKGARLAADVSAIADPYNGFDIYDSYGPKGSNNFWFTYGGTSLASPVVAGMYGLAGGAHGSAYPADTAYINAQVHKASVFDVVPYKPTQLPSGNSLCGGVAPSTCYDTYSNPNALGDGILDCSLPRNGSDPTGNTPRSSECNTVKGYDGPTGVGSPASIGLFHATTPSVALSGPAKGRKGQSLKYSVTAHESVPNTKITGYLWVWGDGKSTQTKTPSATHAYTAAGRHVLSVFVIDSRYQETFRQALVTIG